MKYLSPAAFTRLQTILANDGGGNLELVANWADQVRSDPAYKWYTIRSTVTRICLAFL
jgi:hypothetical protein